jgi:erythromycin esterase-like protein
MILKMIKNSPIQWRLSKFLFIIYLIFVVGMLQAKVSPKLMLVDKIIQEICDKNLVVLGELPSHGEAIGFKIKAEIVRKLVEKCDFNGLFFEAGIYDFIGFQLATIGEQAQQNQLDNAIGGFWTSDELKTWRQWLFSQATSQRLLISGLDDQISRSSHYAKATLPKLVSNYVDEEYKKPCKQAIERYLFWRYDSNNPYNQSEQMLLVKCSQLAFDTIRNQSYNEQNLKKLKMLKNLSNLYARTFKQNSAIDRDEIMYENFKWQSEKLPAKSKIIIWTATVHAARKQGELKYKPLGTWLAETLKNKIAVIGFSAYSGQSSMGGNQVKEIANAPDDSLEALVLQNNLEWSYLNASELNKIGIISSRLHGRFSSVNWSDYYDGVVVVKKEQAPIFTKSQ